MSKTIEFNPTLSKKMGTNDRPEEAYYDYYKQQGVKLKKKYGPKAYKNV